MPTRRRVLATACAALAATAGPIGAAAADPAAKAFLDAIYRNYGGPDSRGNPLGEDAATRRLFVPDLAAAMIADAAAAEKRGEVGALDGDPFIDAQDWDIKGLVIDVTDTGPGRALGRARFTNLGKKTAIELDLVKAAAGWRIHEIRMPSGSLRKLFGLR